MESARGRMLWLRGGSQAHEPLRNQNLKLYFSD